MHFSRTAWFEHIKTPTAEPCLIAAGISIYLNWATDGWDNTFPFFISTSKCSLDVLSRTMSGMNLKTWRQTTSCNKGAVCETRGEHLVGVGNLAGGDSGGEESDSLSSLVKMMSAQKSNLSHGLDIDNWTEAFHVRHKRMIAKLEVISLKPHFAVS